jgi:hypothetical protein
MKTKYTNLAIFLLFIYFYPHFWRLKTSRINSFSKINFSFSFLAKFQQQEEENKRLNSRFCGLGHRKRKKVTEEGRH